MNQLMKMVLIMVSTLTYSDVFAGKVIKIGVAGPMTGAYAAFGEQQWRGAEQAAIDINARGGINGKKIKLIKGDDSCEPKQAVAVANRLLNADVVAVVGHFCSSSTMPASEIYDDEGILMITHGSTNPKITERNLPTILRACGRDDQQGIVAAEYLINKLKSKRIAVIHDKDTYGKGLADAMQLHLKKLGGNVVLYEGLTRGEKDFNALVTKVKSVKADTVYFGGLHTEAGPLVRQIREQGLQVNFVSGDGIVSDDFLLTAGGVTYAKGVMMTFGKDPRNIKSGAAIVNRFRKSGYEPEGYTLYAYAALQSVAAAISATKSSEGETLARWLKSHTVDTIMGKKSWNAKGDLTISDYVMYRWDEQGKYAEIR